MERANSDSTTEPYSILGSSYENAPLFMFCVYWRPEAAWTRRPALCLFLDQMLLMPPQSSCLRGVGKNIHFSGDVRNGRVKDGDERLKLIYRGNKSCLWLSVLVCVSLLSIHSVGNLYFPSRPIIGFSLGKVWCFTAYVSCLLCNEKIHPQDGAMCVSSSTSGFELHRVKSHLCKHGEEHNMDV